MVRSQAAQSGASMSSRTGALLISTPSLGGSSTGLSVAAEELLFEPELVVRGSTGRVVVEH